jgi:hypothetical protein
MVSLLLNGVQCPRERKHPQSSTKDPTKWKWYTAGVRKAEEK